MVLLLDNAKNTYFTTATGKILQIIYNKTMLKKLSNKNTVVSFRKIHIRFTNTQIKKNRKTI